MSEYWREHAEIAMNEAAELKPCPFCGRDEAWHVMNASDNRDQIICGFCAALGPGRQGESEAISAWNKRAG